MKWYEDLESQAEGRVPDDLWIAFRIAGLEELDVDIAQVLDPDPLSFILIAGDRVIRVEHDPPETSFRHCSLQGGVYNERMRYQDGVTMGATYEHVALAEPLVFNFTPPPASVSQHLSQRTQKALEREAKLREKLREWASVSRSLS